MANMRTYKYCIIAQRCSEKVVLSPAPLLWVRVKDREQRITGCCTDTGLKNLLQSLQDKVVIISALSF